jgi:hypothetical protein
VEGGQRADSHPGDHINTIASRQYGCTHKEPYHGTPQRDDQQAKGHAHLDHELQRGRMGMIPDTPNTSGRVPIRRKHTFKGAQPGAKPGVVGHD